MWNVAWWSVCCVILFRNPVVSSQTYTVIESDVATDTLVHDVTNSERIAKLTCYNGKEKSGSNVRDIIWEYKRCGFGLSMTQCDELSEDVEWQLVLCRNQTKLCTASTLPIYNPTELDSGLYRCLHKNYMMTEFQINRMIQLIVNDDKTKSIEIVGEEHELDNQIIFENETAVLRCRVRSVTPPSIVWARPDVSATVPNQNFIHVDGIPYEILNLQDIHKGPDKLYTSKLNIRHTKLSDTGQYLCIALDGKKQISKKVSLTVLPLSTYYLEKNSGASEIWWIAFALILSGTCCVLVLCFLIRRSKSKVDYIASDDEAGEYLQSRPPNQQNCCC